MSGSEAGPYFAFIDGSLDYDCIACGSQCCQGHGFGGMLTVEMDALLERQRELLYWVQSLKKGHVLLSSPSGRCLYLAPDGRCRIEATRGRQDKPGICRQFPFSPVVSIGDRLVVMPHFMCPLEVVAPARPGEVAGSHRAVLKDLQATGLDKYPASPLVRRQDEGADAAIACETDFRTACGAGLGTRCVSDTVVISATDETSMRAFLRRAAIALGDVPVGTRARDRFDDLEHAVLPAFRLSLLTLSPEGRLRALLLADAMVRPSFAGSAQPATVKGVAGFLEAVRPLVTVLAHDDEPFRPLAEWEAGADLPHFDEREVTAAFGVMIVLSRQGYGTLDALDEALAPVRQPLQRVLFIRALHSTMKPPRANDTDPSVSSLESVPLRLV